MRVFEVYFIMNDRNDNITIIVQTPNGLYDDESLAAVQKYAANYIDERLRWIIQVIKVFEVFSWGELNAKGQLVKMNSDRLISEYADGKWENV